MSLFYDSKKETFRAACCVSRGASVTLVSGTFGYTALFEHANNCAKTLGHRGLREMADGIYESVPSYTIPTEEMMDACQKLLQVYSVALVECVFDEKKGARFVLVWLIHCKPDAVAKASLDLDDY